MLTKCPECQKDVSSEASSCPHCGFPIHQKLYESRTKSYLAIPPIAPYKIDAAPSVSNISAFGIPEGQRKMAIGLAIFIGLIVLTIAIELVFSQKTLQMPSGNYPARSSTSWEVLKSATYPDRGAGAELATEKLDKSSLATSPQAVPFKSAVIFTRASTGYDWQKADSRSKQQFCETIATAMTKQFKRIFTADFYFSALETFYDSSDPNIVSQNIHQVIALTTSAALN